MTQMCAVCGASPMSFRWSDYSGEGMCTRCGCPYQLKWGTEEQQEEGNYPYLEMKDEWVPIAREYWEQTHAFVTYGMSFGRPGMRELVEWCEKHHPEMVTIDEPAESKDTIES